VTERFHTTRWSLVTAAGRWRPDAADDEARAALGELAEAYWPPLYAYARRRGSERDEAADLVQGFFARLVEKGGLEAEQRERDRFRAFLLTAFQRFCANRAADARALKRGGGKAPLSLEALTLDREEDGLRDLAELAGGEPPERTFQRRWALQVMERALARLALEQERAGKRDLYGALRPHLSPGEAAPPHAEVAARLGTSEGAVKVALHRLRRRYGELVREEVAGTLADPTAVEAELAALIEALER
jgi:RNA polymerase sigma-70 factor (ECF subfamily)